MIRLFIALVLLLTAIAQSAMADIEKKKTSMVAKVKITHYSSYELRKQKNKGLKTASDKTPQRGFIAVSRDLYKLGWTFGKKIVIPGFGTYIIEDLMHQRKRRQLDIFTPSYKEALKMGIFNNVQAYLID